MTRNRFRNTCSIWVPLSVVLLLGWSVLFTSAGPRALAAAPAAVAASSSVLAAAPWADGGAPFGGMPVGIGIVVAPDVSELFHRAYVVRWERPIQFREVRTVVRHGVSDTVVRQVWWRPWTDLRVEEEHEQGRRIMLWNDDGHWMYDSRYPFVLHLESHHTAGPHGIGADTIAPRPGERLPPTRAPRYIPNANWSSREDVGPGGRDVYVVERSGRGVESRWWIDRELHFPWKEEHFGPEQTLAAVVIRSDVKFDADIADEVFSFAEPTGVEVLNDPGEWRRRTVMHAVRERSPFPAAVPRFVPAGYALMDGDIARVDGKPALHWRFYDGERLLSVFQVQLGESEARRRRSPRPTVAIDQGRTVVGIVQQGYLFLVVGEVTPDEAMDILNSLEEVDD